MNEKKKPDQPEPTLEVPIYNPALDSAAAGKPGDAPPTYSLLDLDEPNPAFTPTDPPAEPTIDIPPLDKNPARRKPQ